MKRKSLLLLLLFALMAPWAAQAQQTVTIGDGTATTNQVPIGTYYNYSITEMLYTAAEIGTAGTISSISFYYMGIAAKDFPITVYMQNADADDLSTGISLADADMVFNGTLSVTTTEGWVTINLDTPFTFDGTSNLLIGINKVYCQWASGQSWQGTSVSNMALYSHNDNTGAYDTGTVPGSAASVRPNIQIIITPSIGPVCEKPETFEVSDITTNGATFTWTGGSGSYNFAWKKASEEAWITNPTTNYEYTLVTLNPATTYNVRVQSVCGTDPETGNPITSGWKSMSFATECGAITDFPWTETFESYNTGEFSDPCWINERIQDGEGYATLSRFKVSTPTNIGDNSTRKLQLPDMPEGTLTKLVLPEMTLPANYEFSIDVYRSNSTYNENYPYEGIRVYASTNGEIEGATALAFIPRHFEVSNDVIPAESEMGWYTYELPIGMSGTCYIILRGESQYCAATYMDNLTVKPAPTCLKPTVLAVTANSVTAHNATITWTENGEANTWIVEFATDADFTDVLYETVEDTPSYTFQGLAPETTYYVRVKAHCGPGDESEYSKVVNFTTAIACPAPANLVANPGNNIATLNWNGTSNSNSYIVNYRTATYAEGLVEEFNVNSIPAGWTKYSGLVDEVVDGTTTLSTVNNGWISTHYAFGEYNVKLNIFGANVKHWLVTPEFNLSQNLSFDLALTDYGNNDPIENDTLQADDRFAVLIYADGEWHILREWNNSGSAYVYNAISATGENVTIDLSAYYGQDVMIAFYGESTNPSDMTNTGGDNDLHIDNVVCGIPYPAGEWQTVTVSDTTVTITDLTPETAYEARVLSDCGELDSLSLWTPLISFTTLEDCPVPQNVEVDDITNNSATVAWDGYNDSYSVSYRTAAYVDGIIEHFDVSDVPDGWTRYSGLVDEVLEGTTTLAPIANGWSTTSYTFGNYNMKVNIYGLGIKFWLVTPEFRLSQNLSFDLALTDYNNADPIENDTLQADDRFIVLIYADDAWHVLREWNNSGSNYVYNAISYTGENVSIDLSAYYGKKVKIAFYGESTRSGGDNDLHIDNVTCGIPYEAGGWHTIEADESPVILSSLDYETDYEVKVMGFCDDFPTEWSETIAFTTLCPSFTKTIAPYEGNGGYYLIASPLDDDVDPATVGMITADEGEGDDAVLTYDLYSFNQAQENEWQNYRVKAFKLVNGQGYLYASKGGIELTFTGSPYHGNGQVTLSKTDNDTVNFQGWNLVGNPFSEEAYLTDNRDFYIMNPQGHDIILREANSIPAMEGIFVIATEDNETITFSTGGGTGGGIGDIDDEFKLMLNLISGGNVIDRAIVRFGEGPQLPKLQLRNNSTKVYLPKEGHDYAVVNVGRDVPWRVSTTEIPVNFKADSDGTYTLSFTSQAVSFSYLHLIDSMTGNDIDLLQTPNYAFEARTSESPNRFKLVFALGDKVKD